MVRRKGELSRGQIDRGWPHQVLLPAAKVQGGMFYTTHYFCEGLSLCPRTKSFRARFSGEIIDPEDQPHWGGASRRRA